MNTEKILKSIVKAAVVAPIAIAAIAGLSAAPASAQTSEPSTTSVERPLRVQLGVFLPSSTTVKNATDDVHFSGGVAYDFLQTHTLTNPVKAGVYADFTTLNKHSNELTNLGLGVQGRYYVGPANTNRATEPYLGLGVGAYSVHLKDEDTGYSKTQGKFGGKVSLGVDTPSGVYAEANYTLIDKINGVDPSGTNLQIGYRF